MITKQKYCKINKKYLNIEQWLKSNHSIPRVNKFQYVYSISVTHLQRNSASFRYTQKQLF